MENRLEIIFNLLEHPYPETISSQFEVWGQIDVNLWHVPDAQRISLLGIQWDVAIFSEWFADSWLSICKGELTIGDSKSLILPSESIAEAMRRLQDRDFLESEEEAQFTWFSELFNFREKHSLRFALRGTSIPQIYVGYNHYHGEISLATDTENWSYTFDMLDFCKRTKESLQGVLKGWMANSSNTVASERIQKLITRLEQEIDCRYCQN